MHFRVLHVILAIAVTGMGAVASRGDDPPADATANTTAQETPAAEPATDQPATDKPAGEEPASDDPEAVFKQKLDEWKKMLSQLREIQVQYRAAQAADRPKIEEKFNETVAQGMAMKPELEKAAEAAFTATDGKNVDATDFLVSMAVDASQRDAWEEARRLTNLLIDKGYDNKSFYGLAGTAAFNTHDFEAAEKYLTIARDAGVLDEQTSRMLPQATEYKEKWAREQEFRAAEGKADDLPRVRLKTNKGDIVIELFENEAPNTVANFVSLVDKGFYNGLPFHRVLGGFMAQGGDPKGDGSGGPGYTIDCECEAENHREHFRGSLSMAHAGKNTGGSQFFITFVPTGHLNGKHTVFGRVVEGLDVLSKLTRRDPSESTIEPDKIEEATVVRKRDHDYAPKTNAQ